MNSKFDQISPKIFISPSASETGDNSQQGTMKTTTGEKNVNMNPNSSNSISLNFTDFNSPNYIINLDPDFYSSNTIHSPNLPIQTQSFPFYHQPMQNTKGWEFKQISTNRVITIKEISLKEGLRKQIELNLNRVDHRVLYTSYKYIINILFQSKITNKEKDVLKGVLKLFKVRDGQNDIEVTDTISSSGDITALDNDEFRAKYTVSLADYTPSFNDKKALFRLQFVAKELFEMKTPPLQILSKRTKQSVKKRSLFDQQIFSPHNIHR